MLTKIDSMIEIEAYLRGVFFKFPLSGQVHAYHDRSLKKWVVYYDKWSHVRRLEREAVDRQASYVDSLG